MKAETIVAQKWDDLVFENRNKEYGAYFNRKVYSKNVFLAVVIMMFSVGFVLAYPTIVRLLTPEEVVVVDAKPKQLTVNLDQPPPIQPNQPPPPKFEIPPVKTVIKFLPPKVTEKEIIEEEEMPTIEEIKQNETSTETVEGTGEVVFEPVEEIVDEGPGDDYVFTIVEQMPEFAGGYEAMMKFISKNTRYPASARRMGTEGSVYVSFVVDAGGNISEVAAIKGISADCDKEAVRVVSMMPPWKSGKQNGKPVKVRFVLPIKFKIG